MISKYLDRATQWFSGMGDDSWRWVDGLDRQEWLILLVMATAIGFFCMRGFGSRKEY